MSSLLDVRHVVCMMLKLMKMIIIWPIQPSLTYEGLCYVYAQVHQFRIELKLTGSHSRH